MIPRRKLPIKCADFREWKWRRCGGIEDEANIVADFERAVSSFLDVPFVLATASGRDALTLILTALGLKNGDELIVPAYTLGELMPIIRSAGARPAPADIESETFNLDVASVEKRINSRTKAILATHLFGAPCDIAALTEIGNRRGLIVIEDCAHAFGARVNNRPVGGFGAAALFSLETSKAVPTYGGGLVVTRDPRLAEAIGARLRRRGRSRRPILRKVLTTWAEELLIRSPLYGPLARFFFHPAVASWFESKYRGSHDRFRGEPVAFSGFQARLGLKRLNEVNDRNQIMNNRWAAFAKSLPPTVRPQVRDRIGEPAFHAFVALSETRPEKLRREAARRGVDVGIGGEVADDCARLLGFHDCPVAADVHSRALLLPLYPALRDREQDQVIRTIRALGGSGKSLA
jgi:dTDP-4-amino-4,6-dideoxygalactose transaminase